MAATKEDIREWLNKGYEDGFTHMIVACDTFDHSDYPVFVHESEDVKERVEKVRAQEMTRVMEVYSYDMDLEQQLNEKRAYNLEVKAAPEIPLETFIGTKIVKGRSQDCQKDNHNSKVGDPGYEVHYEDEYISWSPKDVFEGAYRKADGMTFGLAIEAMMKGLKVRHSTWDGGVYLLIEDLKPYKGMSRGWVMYRVDVNGSAEWDPNQHDIFEGHWQIWEEK